MDTLDVLTYHIHPIPPNAVRHLYDLLGWWPHRSLGDIAQALTAGPAVAAWDGPTLIGLARAVTDGPLRAYVEDVAVHPAYRPHGLGTRLLTRLLDELSLPLSRLLASSAIQHSPPSTDPTVGFQVSCAVVH